MLKRFQLVSGLISLMWSPHYPHLFKGTPVYQPVSLGCSEINFKMWVELALALYLLQNCGILFLIVLESNNIKWFTKVSFELFYSPPCAIIVLLRPFKTQLFTKLTLWNHLKQQWNRQHIGKAIWALEIKSNKSSA